MLSSIFFKPTDANDESRGGQDDEGAGVGGEDSKQQHVAQLPTGRHDDWSPAGWKKKSLKNKQTKTTVFICKKMSHEVFPNKNLKNAFFASHMAFLKTP